ncbi:PAS domain-containing protein [Candidatus Sodalis endolongispinus]|uniref:PAS domain-containing protein n=1 Tax=Candidatus Sodalis endolongispinus TaxID=2812662 RepID=UPI0028AAC525|nr:PAS domain-containing protein [Candidatus Sodalis endolongispinus]
MENKPMNKGKCLTLESLNAIPILAMMERSSLPWGMKDKNSRYVYMNAASLAYFNVPEKFDFEGMTEDEFPCRWSALAQYYQLHDRKAEQTPGGAEIITMTYYGKDQILEPNYCPKFPLYSQTGEVLGTIFYTKKLSCVSITDFLINYDHRLSRSRRR